MRGKTLHSDIGQTYLGPRSTNYIPQVYAPTLDADDIVKGACYSQLQAFVDEVPTGDILIVTGDWNARTGPADATSRHVLGSFVLGIRCFNRERLVNFATDNRLAVTNTRFQHPRRH